MKAKQYPYLYLKKNSHYWILKMIIRLKLFCQKMLYTS